jgi:tripartite-type tricarboxylate transporter receptor subunit TctC
VPSRTPADIVQTLNRQIKTALVAPDVAKRLVTLGFDAVASAPEEFSAQMKVELEKWATVIKMGNLKPE